MKRTFAISKIELSEAGPDETRQSDFLRPGSYFGPLHGMFFIWLGHPMLHHVEINVSNLGASRAFWSEILSKLGYKLTAHWEERFTLSNGEDAYLTFVQVTDKFASHKYNRRDVGLNHLAFKVKGRSLVDSLRQYCLDNNITVLYDERYPFANGGNDYYALYIEDPDRIKVEFVAT